VANITQAEAQRLLDATNGVAAYTAPTTPIKARLTTTTPTSTTAGTEAAGGSYVAQQLNPFVAASAATPSLASNTNPLSYAGMPAITVTSVDEFDSAGTPFRRWFGNLAASKNLNAGDTFSIAAGSYQKSLG
jgi:hypothetical protein